MASTKSNMTGFVTAKGTVPVGVDSSSKKCKSDDEGIEQVAKKNQSM